MNLFTKDRIRVYFPKKDNCKWLTCHGKGYNQFEGFCSGHYKRGLLLGDNKQCSYFDNSEYCLTETKETFNKRYYCSLHKKLLTEYEKEINKIEKDKKNKPNKTCNKHGKNT